MAICDIILTILQSLVGFNQPSTTQSRKTLGNDLVFVKSSNYTGQQKILEYKVRAVLGYIGGAEFENDHIFFRLALVFEIF